MGFMDETENWLLWQASSGSESSGGGAGMDPNGEGGCLFNLGCTVFIIVFFLLVLFLL